MTFSRQIIHHGRRTCLPYYSLTSLAADKIRFFSLFAALAVLFSFPVCWHMLVLSLTSLIMSANHHMTSTRYHIKMCTHLTENTQELFGAFLFLIFYFAVPDQNTYTCPFMFSFCLESTCFYNTHTDCLTTKIWLVVLYSSCHT